MEYSLNHEDVKSQICCLCGVMGADGRLSETFKELQRVIIAE